MLTDVTPVKIAFVGDWHMNKKWAHAALQYAANQGVDTVLHTGDFGYTFRPSFLNEVNSVLGSHDMRLFFVDGNHENHDYIRQLPRNDDGTGHVSKYISHLPRGYRWTWDHVRFLAMGGAVSVDQRLRVEGVSWWRGEELSSHEVAEAMLGGFADVVVSHDAPAGHLIPGIDEDTPMFPEDLLRASAYNRGLLRRLGESVRPDWWYHGHYHVAYSALATFAGRPAAVVGLDCDGTEFPRNMTVQTLHDLRATKELYGGGSPQGGLDGEALVGEGERRADPAAGQAPGEG